MASSVLSRKISSAEPERTPSAGRSSSPPAGTRGETTSSVEPDRTAGGILLDLQRILLLLGKCLKFGLFPLAGYFPIPGWRQPLAVRLRRALEELGLTFLKLGQFLAIRYDVLPAEICRELSKLFDRVQGMPYEHARAIIESELGQRLEDHFLHFQTEAIAAASVGQVHEAVTSSGERVAVKVQRPGIRRLFLADIRNLRRLAAVVEASGLGGRLALREVVGEFASWTSRELDFLIEGRTADRLRQTAGPVVHIPRVYWDLTTPRVLTLEFINGLTATEVGKLLAEGGEELVRTRLAGFEAKKALHRLADSWLAQPFTHGFFHADAHPGNVFFCDNNTVAFLDFGIFGSLTEAERAVLTGHFFSLAMGNFTACYRYYRQELIPSADTDEEAVRQACLVILKDWYQASLEPTLPIEERHLARYMGAMIEVARHNGLRFCLNYLLFWRAVNTLNATAWLVDLQFDLLSELRGFFARTQPGPAERFARSAGDFGRNQDNFVRAANLAQLGSTALNELADQTMSWPLVAQAAPRHCRAEAKQARWLAVSILLVGLAALLAGGSLAWPVGLGLTGLVLAALLPSLWGQT